MSKKRRTSTRHKGKSLPTSEQARIGAVVAADNADGLLKAGAWIAMQRAFGHGICLVVLALEEAVKARALMAVWRVANTPGARLGFTDDHLRDLIYGNHQFRHVVAFIQGLSNEGRTAMFGVQPRDAAGRERLGLDLATGEWLMKANNLKQRGMYTDFRLDGGWGSPSDVTEDEFAHAIYVVKTFVDETLRQAEGHRTSPAADKSASTSNEQGGDERGD